jgi:hypothetical protein
MEHLSSCYFCGAALDDPLGEYPIVPEQLRETDDPGTTATLCPACHRKLETVLSAVVGATGDDAVTLDPVTDDQSDFETDAADDPETGEDTGITADEGTPMETEREATDEPDGSDSAEAASDASEATATSERGSPPETDDEGSVDDVEPEHGDDTPGAKSRDPPEPGADGPSKPETGDDADPLESPGESEPTTVDDADGRTEPTRAERATEHDETTADDEPAGDDGTTEEDEPASDDEPVGTDETTEDGETASDDETADAARTGVSALEYNKVMRLLQNRQFPVDREEIEIVAANAYDLSRRECAQVIDLAVDRGLIDESGDRLVRPD